MVGGDISKKALLDSFNKIKQDISRLNKEIYGLKKEYKSVLKENIKLKKKLTNPDREDLIQKVVKETIEKLNNRTINKNMDSYDKKIVRKLKRNKKVIVKNRIIELANRKNLCLPEIRDIVVHDDNLCSRATFYRYVDKLKKRSLIQQVDINQRCVVVTI